METIATIVGFLGAGKTTLLKQLVTTFQTQGWHPYVILNDYLDAELDAEQIRSEMFPDSVRALTGSCICCDGINELRDCVNGIPARDKGITLIEANGTSDAAMLMGFLGVGLQDRYLPPIQISVVDARNWQKRGFHNELEMEQVKVSSLMLLTHLEGVSRERAALVEEDLRTVNPRASIVPVAELDSLLISGPQPVAHPAAKLDHGRTHWSSCSVNLPDLPDAESIQMICDAIPPEILRIKGCTRIGGGEESTYFERGPDGQIYVRPYHGKPWTGPKLLTVGPGSEPALLENAVAKGLNHAGESS